MALNKSSSRAREESYQRRQREEVELTARPGITRHRTVLTLLQELRMGGPKTLQAQFGYTDWNDSDGGPGTTLNLNHGVWEELGKPETITISVEPGDPLTQEHGKRETMKGTSE